MRTRTPTPDKARLRSFPITPSDSDTLDRLASDATDVIGRSISQSAVVRALIRFAGSQEEDWALATLFPYIERELQSGFLWGKQTR